MAWKPKPWGGGYKGPSFTWSVMVVGIVRVVVMVMVGMVVVVLFVANLLKVNSFAQAEFSD